jgi:hypothetical protein
MRPLKASIFFVYCLAALTAIGTAVSHLWNTSKLLNESRANDARNNVRPS